MENVKEYIEQFSIFGDPVEYKGFKIKPVLVKDYQKFLDASEILKIEKNKVPDISIIQMSYLKFLIELMCIDNETKELFIDILTLCFGVTFDESKVVDNKEFDIGDLLLQTMPNGEQLFTINGWDVEMRIRGSVAKLVIQGQEMSSKDFDDIRLIILYQNLYYFDEIELNMSEDFKKVITQYYTLKNKGITPPSVEDKMMAIITNTSYTIDMIKEMPFRSFEKLFDYSVAKIDYMATKPLEAHLKKGHSIDHWVYRPERQKYSEIFKDAGKVAKEITSL